MAGSRASDHGADGGGTRTGLRLAALLGVAALVWLERRRALRQAAEPGAARVARNLAVAGASAVVIQLAERPVTAPLARRVAARRLGLGYALADRLELPEWARRAVVVLLMDYTLYWWHVVEHRVAWLYRFHVVHHADLDLDTSTAFRFHFGEFLLSVPWRAAQIVAIGADPASLALWQRLTTASVLVHHSNLRLPLAVERWLARLVMTPRLHGIHHSVVRDEQDANWSSGLTAWDRLHGTYRANVPQREVQIGVPMYREPEQVALPAVLAMPFGPQPQGWCYPDGTAPATHPSASPTGRLLP